MWEINTQKETCMRPLLAVDYLLLRSSLVCFSSACKADSSRSCQCQQSRACDQPDREVITSLGCFAGFACLSLIIIISRSRRSSYCI